MAEKTFAKRLFEALSDMENPVKDSTADVGKYSYDYVTLSGVFDAVKPVLSKHGLMMRQSVEKDGDVWSLKTYVFDATEERLLDERPMIFDSNSQNNGIRETYARRYAINCCMGLAPVDSDAVETRNTVQTPDSLKEQAQRGIAKVKSLGIDTEPLLTVYAGWENDMNTCKKFIGALASACKSATKGE